MKRFTKFALASAVLLAGCADQIPTSTPPIVSAKSGGPLWTRATAPEFVAGQIIVRYRESASPDDVRGRHRGRKKADMLLERTEIVEVADGDELAVANEMSNDPDVEFAQPDIIYRIAPCEVSMTCLLPDGQFFNVKWDLYNPGSFLDPALGAGIITTGKADADIDWVELYDHLGPGFTGSAKIGVLDTGIRPTHGLFLNKIAATHRFLADTLTIAGGVNNVTDDNGHGSHTAGIAAGRSGAAVSGVGYSANIKLVIGKVCSAAGTCPSSGTANAIIWATDQGANVINISLGSFGGFPDGSGSPAQQAAMQYALSKNTLVVCSSGNDHGGTPPAGWPTYTGGIGYPARFPECMAVGASDWGDNKASYSNFGPQLAVSAPGGDGERQPYSLILSASATSNTGYAFNAGTSMAAPQVAGAAALLYAMGYTTPAAVRQRLIETADDLEAPGWDPRTGYGRINVYRAVTGLDPNAAPVADPGAGYAGNKGVAVQFDGSASNDPNGKPVTFAWNFGDPSSASNTSLLAQPSHTYMRAGNYTVTLTVTDAANIARTSTRTAVIPNIVPAIGALAGATILQGETYGSAGGFTDADPDGWTATVSYGDGSATSALALTDAKTFALSHQYEAAGAHTVSVSVSDDDGGTGTQTGTVTVLSPAQGAQNLIAEIEAAMGISSIQSNGNSADASFSLTSMTSKLRNAVQHLGNGNLKVATGDVESFIKHVDDRLRQGRVSAADAAAWSSMASRIIASINR
jgi:subtilisin family serine protease